MTESTERGDDARPPNDLLVDPVFTVQVEDGARESLSLAELFARIAAGRELELAYVMPHQQHAVHAFVVQTMAIAIARTGWTNAWPADAEAWHDALRKIAGSVEAFQLVVDDLGQPAFMQPPVPERKLDKYKPVASPDLLDLLVLAKNHDVKTSRLRAPRPEQWVFALLSLQTQQGYSGRDNHGVARMNGGFGNRPGIGMAPSLAWCARIRRDVEALVADRGRLVSTDFPYADDGIAFVWTAPWDGEQSLSMDKLDPFFVEICRRVRFTRSEDELGAWMTSTKVPRLAGKELLGNTGDPWTPIEVERGVALTLPGDGFTYARMVQLLFDPGWKRPISLALQKADGDSPVAIARALVRGQGKTEGLHERVVWVPAHARRFFSEPDAREALRLRAEAAVVAAANMRLKVLKPALLAFIAGGAEDLDFKSNQADAVLAELEHAVDASFFDELFANAESDDETASAQRDSWLVKLGRRALEHGIAGLPTRSARRERATAAAEGRFRGGVYKHFPGAARAQPEPTSAQEATS